MPKLTLQRYDQIMAILENSFLTAAGYNVITDGSDTLINITVKDYKELFISLNQATRINWSPGSGPQTFLACIESPGDYVEKQQSEFSDFDDFLQHLRAWCERAKAALIRNVSVQSQISKMREDFEKELASHVDDINAHFTPEEKLRRREKSFSEKSIS